MVKSMELFFISIQLFLLGYLIARNNALSKKINLINKNQLILDETLFKDTQDISKYLNSINERLNAIPDMFKDDIYRSLLPIRESLEGAKPMKTNNWDSIREAFKGPVRVEINERN